jgi:hypothetical protein
MPGSLASPLPTVSMCCPPPHIFRDLQFLPALDPAADYPTALLETARNSAIIASITGPALPLIIMSMN